MIPLLWRYFLFGYLRVFALSISAFLAILLISRFQEIARFTALTGSLAKTLCFIAYQFPLILPIAIPLSALIASTLLMQRLSKSHELLAFRAAGCSWGALLAPLLLASVLASILNFSICSELAPFCQRASKTMLFSETSENPLLLLQRQQLVKAKHAYINMELNDEGTRASNVTLITYHNVNQRLNLLRADNFSVHGDELLGNHVTLLSHLNSKNDGFDPLLLEYQNTLSTKAPLLSQFLKKSAHRLEAASLPLSELILRAQNPTDKISVNATIELLRRTSLSLAVFSFTLLGCSYGIIQGRGARLATFSLAALALLILAAYILGKELKTYPSLAFLVFLLPHPFLWFACILRLKRLNRGAL